MRYLLCVFLLGSLNSYSQNFNVKDLDSIVIDVLNYHTANGVILQFEYRNAGVDKIKNVRISTAKGSLAIDSTKGNSIQTIVNNLIDEAKPTRYRTFYIEIDSIYNELIMRVFLGVRLNSTLLPKEYYDFSDLYIDDTFVVVEDYLTESFSKPKESINNKNPKLDYYLSNKYDYSSYKDPEINLVRYYMYNNGEFEEIRMKNVDLSPENIRKAISFFSQFKNNLKNAPVYDGEKTLWTEPVQY